MSDPSAQVVQGSAAGTPLPVSGNVSLAGLLSVTQAQTQQFVGSTTTTSSYSDLLSLPLQNLAGRPWCAMVAEVGGVNGMTIQVVARAVNNGVIADAVVPFAVDGSNAAASSLVINAGTSHTLHSVAGGTTFNMLVLQSKDTVPGTHALAAAEMYA